MKCKACDTLLSEPDLVRKDKFTGEYMDLCGVCYLESQAALYEAQSDNSMDYVESLCDKLTLDTLE